MLCFKFSCHLFYAHHPEFVFNKPPMALDTNRLNKNPSGQALNLFLSVLIQMSDFVWLSRCMHKNLLVPITSNWNCRGPLSSFSTLMCLHCKTGIQLDLQETEPSINIVGFLCGKKVSLAFIFFYRNNVSVNILLSHFFFFVCVCVCI